MHTFFFPSEVLKNVSAIRDENMLQDFLSDEVPSRDLQGYHEKCYQDYTNKQKLNRIAEKRKKERYENEALCKKCPNSELFWFAFSRILTGYGSNAVRIQFECDKMWTRITPTTDTFYTVNRKEVPE